MDSGTPDTALGALALAICLTVPLGVVALLGPAPPSPHPTMLEPPAGTPSVTAVALGWPIHHQESDPRAWEELDGVGHVLGGRLAAAAEAGDLTSSASLLRVPGIGVRMAADLSARIEWPPTEASR